MRDQCAQGLITCEILGKQHELEAVIENDLAADDQRNTGFLRCLQGPHNAGKTALVGDRKRAVAELGGALEQLKRGRGPALKREIRQTVQLGIVGDGVHAQTASREPPMQQP